MKKDTIEWDGFDSFRAPRTFGLNKFAHMSSSNHYTARARPTVYRQRWCRKDAISRGWYRNEMQGGAEGDGRSRQGRTEASMKNLKGRKHREPNSSNIRHHSNNNNNTRETSPTTTSTPNIT